MACYKEAILTANYTSSCAFLSDPKATLLNQTSFSLSFLYSNFTHYDQPFMYFIVDNTAFPWDGSMPVTDIAIDINYFTYLEPTKNYARLILICKKILDLNNFSSRNFAWMLADSSFYLCPLLCIQV
jgi:hypothetical protein